MTINLLDLYNTVATQEWSMYDNDAVNQSEMEESLILAINKALTEILYSYEFPFRQRTHIILTLPRINSYDIPVGLIKRDKLGNLCVKLNQNNLKYIDNPDILPEEVGIPQGFYLKNNELVLYPTPKEKFIVTVDYITLAIGENSSGEDVFALKNATDTVTIPAHLEELFKNAVIARTMLNSI